MARKVDPTRLVGRTFGNVRIDVMIGEGSVGVVYRGYHEGLGIQVAVKVLKLDVEPEREQLYRERFKREARITARLDHPGIVRVLDTGEEANIPYLVMEYIDGYTLEQYLRLRGQEGMSERNTLKVLLSAANALQTAHQAGIIHRDLKPANLMLTRKGVLKVADLGLARITGGDEMTRDRVMVGTPAYIAPESVTPGVTVDSRADCYALGVIAYEIAFGKRPYRGSMQEIIHGHIGGTADFSLPTKYSDETIDAIHRMMSVDPAERFQEMGSLMIELRRIAGNLDSRGSGTKPGRKAVPPRTRSGAGYGSSGTRRRTVGLETSSSPGSGTASGELAGIVNFLENRLGSKVSLHEGKEIVHSTSRDRAMVWVMLVGLVLLVVIAIITAGTFTAAKPDPSGESPGAEAAETAEKPEEALADGAPMAAPEPESSSPSDLDDTSTAESAVAEP